MKTGDIVVIPFPFSELKNIKVRPAAILGFTKDIYLDVIVCAISSVVPSKLTSNEMLIYMNSINNLRANSIIKIDRIATLKKESIIKQLGKLSDDEIVELKSKFKSLIDYSNS